MEYSNEIKAWADEIWTKLDKKLSRTAISARNILPYEEKDGKWIEKDDVTWWTNGFWGGLMWSITSGANYAITGNEKSKIRQLKAADFLSSGFNIEGGYIRAWNGGDDERHMQIAIIDVLVRLKNPTRPGRIF